MTLKQFHEDKLRKREENRQRILEKRIAKAAKVSLKIEKIKQKKQSLMTDCTSGEENSQNQRDFSCQTADRKLLASTLTQVRYQDLPCNKRQSIPKNYELYEQ